MEESKPDESDDFLKRLPYFRKLEDFEDFYLYALNQPLDQELDFWANPTHAAKELPAEVKQQRFKNIHVLLEVIRRGHDLAYLEGKLVPRCPLCSKFFIAKRKTQTHCPSCAKKLRQKNWRANYEKREGRPYQQTREAAYVKKVRKALENWKGSFKPTLENKKELAAKADVALKQCEAALEIIADERKRAQTARKR